MPESAEIKLTTDYLKIKLENKIINNLVFLSGKYKDKTPKGFKEFKNNLPLIVENVQCKGKFIYFTLFNENGYIYIMHNIRMSGRWQEYEDDCCRWYIEISDGEYLWFRNPKCFSTVEFTSNYDELQQSINDLGPDILTDEFSLDKWKELVQKHQCKNITSFLMNQNIISGIGNYIKAEALYYAKISPFRKTGSLSEQEQEKLYEGIRIIPRISYNKGGLSIRDYANSEGSKGTYDEDIKIYGKPDADKIKTADGRITYWDSDVQV